MSIGLLAERPPALWKRYNAFLRKPPELATAWHDRETGARGWLVINSLRGGAAGGGTRMRPGAELREVVYLAKSMELKFALSGPPIGGAKSAIDFDPTDPRKPEVLARWYEAIAPFLRECYGTGGDLNVDEVTEVIPNCTRLGLRHPQEGIVRGHLQPGPADLATILSALDQGVVAPVDVSFGLDGLRLTVSDMITGYGVACAIDRFLERQGTGLAGARVRLQGFGNVGASCGLYLARAGARVVGIMDAAGAVIEPEGLDLETLESLIRRRRNRQLPDDPRVLRGRARDAFWDVPADAFVCAALSGAVTPAVLDRLAATGTRVIASGANQPFHEVKIGSTRVQQRADRRFAVLPDFLSNLGMARCFGYLMEPGAEPTADAIFRAVRRTVVEGLDAVVDRAGGPSNLMAATLAIALDRLGEA